MELQVYAAAHRIDVIAEVLKLAPSRANDVLPYGWDDNGTEDLALNIMRLATPENAVLSAVIFNALVIIALVPLALRGVGYRPAPASELLGRNLLIYGIGGIIVPFLGIKIIDVIVSALRLA